MLIHIDINFHNLLNLLDTYLNKTDENKSKEKLTEATFVMFSRICFTKNRSIGLNIEINKSTLENVATKAIIVVTIAVMPKARRITSMV